MGHENFALLQGGHVNGVGSNLMTGLNGLGSQNVAIGCINRVPHQQGFPVKKCMVVSPRPKEWLKVAKGGVLLFFDLL